MDFVEFLKDQTHRSFDFVAFYKGLNLDVIEDSEEILELLYMYRSDFFYDTIERLEMANQYLLEQQAYDLREDSYDEIIQRILHETDMELFDYKSLASKDQYYDLIASRFFSLMSKN